MPFETVDKNFQVLSTTKLVEELRQDNGRNM